ncbi:MAG TPA: C1 family peptidase [Verrucomicrobiae bacterium]|nr:C1 family peptidase [Verrucomicrobiae bacterium]
MISTIARIPKHQRSKPGRESHSPRSAYSSADGPLTPQLLTELRRGFDANPAYKLAMNAVTQTPVDDVALNRSVITNTDFTFSHWLDDWAVTHQKMSGRCWMFAGLNLFRVGAMKKMKLKDFEFSQNYTLFWDKLERANYFLESIIETANRPVDDRVVAFLLTEPLNDGGQWNMFANIVRKHGLVPKALMPETESSSNTGRMNSILLNKLREGAKTLRDLRTRGASPARTRAAKREILAVVHRILCIHLGTPPQKFDWQWNDKSRRFHRDGEMTPQQFARKYITLPLDEYVCLVHDPRPTSPRNRTYTVQHLGNVVGGGIVLYLNVDVDLMKKLTMRSIMKGEPVWMGCDVGKMMRRDLGLWDKKLYEYEAVYDTDFTLTKADRLLYHQTAMTHAMLFTGVDVVNNRPRRWRVENSWGEEKSGRKGFFVMNDSWFNEFMFEIAVRKSALPAPLRNALKLPPIVLPPWDPMGSLAR